VSQLAPTIVIAVGLCFHLIWDKEIWDRGLRGIFFFYLVSGLLEVINEKVGGLAIIYHLSTIIEVGFLLYIYSQWSNFDFKAIFIIYFIIWIFLKVSGIETLQQGMDTQSTILASLIFIFIPLTIFGVKSYQKFFMIVMQIYYGGTLVFFATINILPDKVEA